MTRFAERVARDLQQIADRATPSSTAFASIQSRIDEQTDKPDEEITVIELRTPSQTGTRRDDSRKSRRLWIGGLATAAAAGVLLVIGFVVATADDDPTVTAGPPEATGDVLLAQRVAVIEEAIAVYNEGSLDDFMASLADDARFYAAVEPGPIEQAIVVANDQWTLRGSCQDSAAGVRCPIVVRDDFHGAGGLEGLGSLVFRFNETNEITRVGEAAGRTAYGGYLVFDRDFATWFTENYPEAGADYGQPFAASELLLSFRFLPDPEDMALALQYVDEFVAQSDRYPIDAANS